MTPPRKPERRRKAKGALERLNPQPKDRPKGTRFGRRGQIGGYQNPFNGPRVVTIIMGNWESTAINGTEARRLGRLLIRLGEWCDAPREVRAAGGGRSK